MHWSLQFYPEEKRITFSQGSLSYPTKYKTIPIKTLTDLNMTTKYWLCEQSLIQKVLYTSIKKREKRKRTGNKTNLSKIKWSYIVEVNEAENSRKTQWYKND
jgi:hypothetical protein